MDLPREDVAPAASDPRVISRAGGAEGARRLAKPEDDSGAERRADGASGMAPMAAAAPANPEVERRYRLTNGAGEYVHKSGHGMTRKLADAWEPTAPQMEAAFRRKPHLKDFDVLPVPARSEPLRELPPNQVTAQQRKR